MHKAKYHFFGKDCPIDRALENREVFEKKIVGHGFKFDIKPVFVNQVHGSEVLVLDGRGKVPKIGSLPKVDAIVTNIKKLPICVITADCVPIVLTDEVLGVVGIVHSGWRGAKSGIIEHAIDEMVKLGSVLSDIKAVMGPCIRQWSYEVSQEFFDEFVAMGEENKVFFAHSVNSGHYMFDLPGYCFFKLDNAGIYDVESLKIDTYKSEADFYSYRRAAHRKEEDCGRNISTAMLL